MNWWKSLCPHTVNDFTSIFSLIHNFEMKASVALGVVLALDTPKRKKRSKRVKKWYLCRREQGHTRLLREYIFHTIFYMRQPFSPGHCTRRILFSTRPIRIYKRRLSPSSFYAHFLSSFQPWLRWRLFHCCKGKHSIIDQYWRFAHTRSILLKTHQ